MRITIFFLFIILFSCKGDNFINKFENEFGHDNAKVLTNFVHKFENDYLKKKYPNSTIQIAYKKFLLDYRSNPDSVNNLNLSNIKDQFYNSDIYNEIFEEIELKHQPLNYTGKYHIALNKIRERSNFLNLYIDKRNSAVSIVIQFVIPQFLNDEIDLNDYFVKRLIVTDIALQ